MIESIELINWKTHDHTTMNFQKGVNVLIGVMGAGKSSVIDGISFGLFGTFPKLNHKRTTIEEIISNRPEVMDAAEVRIKFTIGSDEYKVTRKISRRESTTSRIEKNGSYLQTQTARVNEEIENIIKLNYDTFSRAIYAEQNRLDYFLELTKSDRKRQIDEMLGLDSFARAEENTTSLINSIKSLIADEEQTLAQIDRNELRAQLEKLTTERQELEKEQRVVLEDAAQRTENVKLFESEITELKLKAERSKRLSKEIAELSSRIETLRKELGNMDVQGLNRSELESGYISTAKRKEQGDAELKRLRKEESSLAKSLGEVEASVKLNRKKVEERDRLLESIKGKLLERIELEINGKDAALQNAYKEISSLKGRQAEVKEWANELGKHISKCPVCERELDESTKRTLLDQKNGSIREMELKIAQLQKSTESLAAELGTARKELDRVKLASSRIADYKEIEALISRDSGLGADYRSRHSAVSESIDGYAKEAEQLNAEINMLMIRLEQARRREKYESEIAQSSILLAKCHDEFRGINFDEKRMYSLQESLTKESAALGDLNSKAKGNERYMKNIEQQLEEKLKSIAGMDAIAGRVEGRRAQIANMNKFRVALIDTEAQLRNSLITSINSLMQNIWSEIYPYADYSAIRLNARRDDYALEACTGTAADGASEWIEMDGIASGGERSVACLTMRIALAMVIVPNLRWLILDEPTHNIDENGIGKLIDVLSNSLPKVVEQIFIITHDSALKNIASARVYQLERNKDKNEYTAVAEL